MALDEGKLRRIKSVIFTSFCYRLTFADTNTGPRKQDVIKQQESWLREKSASDGMKDVLIMIFIIIVI
jgi:hypothetical protein